MTHYSIQRMLLWVGLCVAWTTGTPTPPFPFGSAQNDTCLLGADEGSTDYIALPTPMAVKGIEGNITQVRQFINGGITLHYDAVSPFFAGYLHAYVMDLDTRNEGENQNQVCVRAGDNANDLNLARDIIAGNGTIFAPHAIVVATWNKVEAFPKVAGAQNTFQLIVAYSASGATWVILAFSQLEFFPNGFPALSDLQDGGANVIQNFFETGSVEDMNRRLNETNCKRPGVYAYRINVGVTQAPTKAPSTTPSAAPSNAPIKAPTRAPAKCGLFGWSIFCPFTLCGLIGRWFGWCETIE